MYINSYQHPSPENPFGLLTIHPPTTSHIILLAHPLTISHIISSQPILCALMLYPLHYPYTIYYPGVVRENCKRLLRASTAACSQAGAVFRTKATWDMNKVLAWLFTSRSLYYPFTLPPLHHYHYPQDVVAEWASESGEAIPFLLVAGAKSFYKDFQAEMMKPGKSKLFNPQIPEVFEETEELTSNRIRIKSYPWVHGQKKPVIDANGEVTPLVVNPPYMYLSPCLPLVTYLFTYLPSLLILYLIVTRPPSMVQITSTLTLISTSIYYLFTYLPALLILYLIVTRPPSRVQITSTLTLISTSIYYLLTYLPSLLILYLIVTRPSPPPPPPAPIR